VNRGPSMVFAAMLAMGHEPVDAIETIRRSRPIAAVLYAVDAVEWWSRRTGARSSQVFEVRRWLNQHPADIDWITLLAG
jgi:dual specificity phosphatase 3